MGLEARMPPLQPNVDASDHEASSPVEDVAELPVLTTTPTAYSGCCLALSEPIVAHLASLLPQPPSLTLSIGSGFGLLERYLITKPHAYHVVGVEVEPSSNKFLPSSNHRIVHGTRVLEPLAAEATTWLFVYPRRVGLVREYLERYGRDRVDRVIWAGPKADWDDYKSCFAGWNVNEQGADQVGGRAWELIAVAHRLTP
jgi:hypothetical protein